MTWIFKRSLSLLYIKQKIGEKSEKIEQVVRSYCNCLSSEDEEMRNMSRGSQTSMNVTIIWGGVL